MSAPTPHADPTGHRIVFIGGLHRSGTTPLARVLSGHPQVSGFAATGAKEDEGQHLQSVYPPARTYGGAGAFARHPGAHLTEASPLVGAANAERLFRQWAPNWDLDRRVLVEKSPPNLVMTRFLQALYPSSSFVLIVRHPVVVALATAKWRRAVALSRLVEHWCIAHQLLLDDLPYLNSAIVLKYEQLVADPKRELARVQLLLGLDSPFSPGGITAGRSNEYALRWRELQQSGATWSRRGTQRLISRHGEQVAKFGYSLEDLQVANPFPVPAT